jgi:cell division protein FtsL
MSENNAEQTAEIEKTSNVSGKNAADELNPNNKKDYAKYGVYLVVLVLIVIIIYFAYSKFSQNKKITVEKEQEKEKETKEADGFDLHQEIQDLEYQQSKILQRLSTNSNI